MKITYHQIGPGARRGLGASHVLLAIVWFLAPAESLVLADTLQLGTGLTLTWDRGAQPGGSDSLVIPVFNESATSTEQLFGWGIGLKVISVGGTGTLSINPSSIA
ncbi:MAG TPA: hypothetical protein VIK18_18355, partial [Pirellulales bacterium]